MVAAATDLLEDLGGELFTDHNQFREKVETALKNRKLKLSAAELKVFYKAVSWRDETASEVVAKVHKAGKATVNPLYGFYEGKGGIIEYESDPDLRDTEQVPLQEDVETFMQREVLPYTPDAWIDPAATKIGYEISFTRHFYKPQPLRSLEDISVDILEVEKEAGGLLDGLLKGGTR